MKIKLKYLGLCISIILVGFISGCIPVDDFGEYWRQGQADPALAGDWLQDDLKPSIFSVRIEDNFLKFRQMGLVEGQLATVFEGDAKTIEMDGMKFLLFDNYTCYKNACEFTMEKSAPPKLRGMFRYELRNRTLKLYSVYEDALIKAIKNGEIMGKLPDYSHVGEPPLPSLESSATITKLDKGSMAFLIKLFRQPDVQVLMRQLERTNDPLSDILQKEAIKKERGSGKIEALRNE